MTLPVLRGHAGTWQRLCEALARDRLAHALLFAGPSGVGKSLTARLLAARVACEAEDDRPCGSCGGCLQVAAGTHPDLLWIAPQSGKKEIGVELARQLKRFAQMRSVSAARKLAVIDDADRLSIAAQNALLKTLEEPPGSALLVLVTASPGALLATVRSRCQRIPFHPLADDEVQAVLEAELADPEEARRWVARAEGSPGRALGLRELWQEGERERLLALLADLKPSRYAPVVAMSKVLGRTEPEMTARLEALLEWYRAKAVSAVRGEMSPDGPIRSADVVGDALRTLRRRNPNRGLLAEALLLRLSRL
jgi:DNA polymerase III subunit delta'